METELWPGFLRECEVQQIPVAIVNGRISERSFRRYQLIKGFMKRVLGSIGLAVMQTDADATRLRALGMKEEKISVAGNIKFDAGSTTSENQLANTFRKRFGLTTERPTILAASTHAPEEKIVLLAFKKLTETGASRLMLRLIIAPRHPERFAEVAGLLKASGVKWTRRSAASQQDDELADVILLDSIGELPSVYGLTPIVFVGGSIAKTGGHNILEPASVGASIITGVHTYNFQAIVEAFVKAGAIIQLPNLPNDEASAELARAIAELLANPSEQQRLGRLASALVEKNRGATERTLKLLEPMLSNHPAAFEPISVTLQGAATS